MGRTKSVDKKIRLTQEKADALKDYLIKHEITLQDLLEQYIDNILEEDELDNIY